MAILCPECDRSWLFVCDFCKYYQFNGEGRGDNAAPIYYVGKGCCSLHFLPSDPEDGCEYFHCFKATEKNGVEVFYAK